ncbi:MAG: 30S ribosomal protein S2 [Candidatus Cloacimonetes bacterium]|nr:30S ribosomal protein S2 [Candidatus Cloacimonadota bacterium]
MKLPTLQELLEAGVHFGHQTKKWNPKMKPYIYTDRGGVHVIDLAITRKCLQEAYKFLRDKASEGARIVFVGTKRQAAHVIREQVAKEKIFYISERWPGGLLTNFENTKAPIERLGEVEKLLASEEKLSSLTTKKKYALKKEKERLEALVGGLRGLKEGPEVLFIVDPVREQVAVREAVITDVPVVALLDTNGDPANITYPIAGNDDALGSISLIVKTMTEAVLEGRKRESKTKRSKAKGSI